MSVKNIKELYDNLEAPIELQDKILSAMNDEQITKPKPKLSKIKRTLIIVAAIMLMTVLMGAGVAMYNQMVFYDMSGNILELCSDWQDYYTTTAKTNPLGPNTGSSRVHRGGDFQHSTERSTVYGWLHDANPPDWRCGDLGFRLVLP